MNVLSMTGRLTSEMVMKSAQMGVPIVVSRSGITQMAFELAERVGLRAVGRATGKHFLCYTGVTRLRLEPELAGPRHERTAPRCLSSRFVRFVQDGRAGRH